MNSKYPSLYVLVFFLVSLQSTVLGQNGDKELHKQEVQAEKAFGFEYYEEAIVQFGELLKKDPSSAKYNYYMGVSHMRSTHHEYALPFLKKAYEAGYRSDGKPEIVLDESHDEYISEDMEFNLARAYHLHEEFEEAKIHYNALKKKYDEVYHNKIHEHEKEIIERYIEQCNNGIELLKSPVDVKIVLLEGEVNTEYEEIVPLVTADQSVLIFTSRNPQTTGGLTDDDGRYMEDIYISYKNSDGKWSKPKSISDNVNTNEHDACVGLSPDGHTLFTYRNNHHGTGDLYQSTLDGDKWSVPEKLPEGINTKYLENSASISSDGKLLFFTSNRPGGVGGEDIYVSRKKSDGSWGKPSNLGVELNTPFDDDAPFIHPDGKTLYFSSKGHTTMGGFDVFKAKYDETKGVWGSVENLGHPINTPENDIFFVFSADGERAYYSSHREEENMGGEDLYVMDFKQEVSLIHLYGLVLTDDDGKPAEGIITVTDNGTGEKVGEYTSNKSTGKYTVILPPGKNYGIYIDAPNCVPFSENVDLPDIGEYYEKKVDFKLHSLVSNKPTVTVLKNVFFDTDKSVLRKESFSELNKYFSILDENKNLQVEIAGHTDTDGADTYNLKLSQKRAQAVVDYFVEKGIDSKRLFAVGYGEAYPVASNADEKGKQQNRRTELIVHDTANEGQDWKNSKGHYNNPSK